MVQDRPERKEKKSRGRFDRARTVDPVRYAQGAKPTGYMKKKRLSLRTRLASDKKSVKEARNTPGQVYHRSPRGSKKTTVGKARRKGETRGSYANHSRR